MSCFTDGRASVKLLKRVAHLIPRFWSIDCTIGKGEKLSYRTYIAASRAAYIAGIEAGISPQELRAHTGVLGEAFVADYLEVKLTPENNQRGFDLVDKDGLRVSVKTITTSTGIALKESTIELVDRVIVVWLDTLEDELDVTVVYDKSTEDFRADCAEVYRGSLRLGRGAMSFPNRTPTVGKFDVGEVVASYKEGPITIRKHSSGSFTALENGQPTPARQHLMSMRDSLGLPDKTNNTTRTLGAQVFGELGK